MPLRFVGFYAELAHGGPEGGNLRDAIRPEPAPDQGRIAAYLRGGTVIAPSYAATVDVLDPAKPRMTTLAFMTDGVYEWPSDLSHFVERYNAELPADFVDHMRAQEFVPRQLGRDEILEIVREQRELMGQ